MHSPLSPCRSTSSIKPDQSPAALPSSSRSDSRNRALHTVVPAVSQDTCNKTQADFLILGAHERTHSYFGLSDFGPGEDVPPSTTAQRMMGWTQVSHRKGSLSSSSCTLTRLTFFFNYVSSFQADFGVSVFLMGGPVLYSGNHL